MTKKLVMATTDLKETVSDVLNFASDKLTASLSFLKDAKEAGAEKINGFVNDILGLAPLIEVTGFNMKDVSVEVGIPPGMTISFIKEKDVDTDTINQLLEANKDKEMLKLIVRALLKADSLQKGMNLSHYKFSGLGMKIGLPPDISLKFVRVSDNP
jgi:inosine-uridine nucleoside N-ribohydrolase